MPDFKPGDKVIQVFFYDDHELAFVRDIITVDETLVFLNESDLTYDLLGYEKNCPESTVFSRILPLEQVDLYSHFRVLNR